MNNIIIYSYLSHRLQDRQSEDLQFYSARFVPEDSLTNRQSKVNKKDKTECEEKTEEREDRGQDQN